MIGQTIEAWPAPPIGRALWLLAAAALGVLAVVTADVNWAVLSALPWSVALLLWLARARPFAVRFTEDALEVDEPPLVVPYKDLQGLLAPGRPANPFKTGRRSYGIQVIHPGGVLRVPARLNVPSDDVFVFLYRQFSPCGSRDVPAALANYLRRQESEFGPEHVWTYRARAHRGHGEAPRWLAAFFLALVLCGCFWVVWGIAGHVGGWAAGGGVLLLFGALFSLIVWLVGHNPQGAVALKNWRRSGLVIAPDGLALVQGDMSGELVWEELRDVKLSKGIGPWKDSNSTAPAIVLQVKGAVITIADVYDRPIALIYQHICHYWRGQPTDEDGDRGRTHRTSPEPTHRPVSEGPSSVPSESIRPPD
jgi:hypothetical protein